MTAYTVDMAKKPKKRLSGAGQIKASGKQAVLVPFEPEEKEDIKAASAMFKQSMASFIALHAAKAAREILKNAK